MAGALRITQDALPGPGGDGTFSGGIATRGGIQVVTDFYTYMAMIGASFQVRAGTISTPLVGDVPITDTRCEYCVDAASGTTLIPVYNNLSLRLMATLSLELAIKSVAAVSTAGTAFTPLLKRPFNKAGNAGSAAVCTARVAAHAVTVTAEAVTTTRREWSYSNPTGNTTAGTNLGIYAFPPLEWIPRMPPILTAGSTGQCVYVQVAAATTGPSYYGALDFIEASTSSLI